MKNGRTCQGCLPQRLGNCTNLSQPSLTPSSGHSHSSHSILNTKNIPETSISDETIPLDYASQTTLDEIHPNVNTTWLFPALQPPNFTWGSSNGENFCTSINVAYEEVVHWRQNVFQVPSGSSGRAFVMELARLFQAYADSSSLECIAMKATIVMQILLLQKPSRASKSKDHVTHLQRRMELWLDGDIQALLDEGKCIQKRLSQATHPSNNDVIARIFRDRKLQGKVQSALQYLSRKTNGGVLKLGDLVPETTRSGESVQRSTRDVLEEKHPLGKDPDACCLVDGDFEPVNPITFDGLDADAIRHAALHTHGAAGPSGLDAYAWRRLRSSFKYASNSLCIALASIARRIATTSVKIPKV